MKNKFAFALRVLLPAAGKFSLSLIFSCGIFPLFEGGAGGCKAQTLSANLQSFSILSGSSVTSVQTTDVNGNVGAVGTVDSFRDSLSTMLGCKLIGPNLAPDGSMEDTVCCPDGVTTPYIHCASPWFEASPSPDYFHECAYPSSVGVPVQGLYAKDGKAFAGCHTYQYFSTGGGVEFIEYPLPNTLANGKKYNIGFYVCPSKWACAPHDAFHAILSTDSIIITSLPYYATPDIANPSGNIISDTLNWTLVSGYYTAKGGEKFVTLGNFYPASKTHFAPGYDSTTAVSYYYFDNLFIYEVEDTATNIIYVPNAFSPNDDGENDIFSVWGDLDELHCEIYNRWGEKVAELNKPKEGWDGRVNGQLCNTGVYFYYLNAKDKNGKEITKKGNVTLMK
ncbi:MAG: gliding motility-associated C-terminal domain-containing protein [Bacteroidetes bacterium]|nr:gliding motility-associated C-terminal domain-containing protein [Bacteroidota bacterium]